MRSRASSRVADSRWTASRGRTAAQLVRDRERGLALAGGAGQLLLDPRPLGEHLVEPRLRRGRAAPARRRAAAPAPGARAPQRVSRSTAATRAASAASRARPLELRRLHAGLAGVGLGRRQLRAHLLEQRRSPTRAGCASRSRAAAQPVERLHRLLAPAGGVGELLLGAAALGEHGVEPLLGRAPRRAPPPRRRSPAAASRSSSAARSSSAIRARSRAISTAELLRPLGRGRLQRERPQALAHLVLEVARALDLDRDARELQLGAVAARLEAPEPGRLLDQRAPLLRPRREDRLDLALADDRVHALAEAEVGEQLDEVEPAHRRAVDEVLALAAAVEPARDRRARSSRRAASPSCVVEEELDLAEVGGPAARRAGEEDVVGLLGAQLVRAERAGRPADRVGDVRLAGAVRADDHADARLEANLDRVGKRLEATELYRAEMHVGRTLAASRTGRAEV